MDNNYNTKVAIGDFKKADKSKKYISVFPKLPITKHWYPFRCPIFFIFILKQILIE